MWIYVLTKHTHKIIYIYKYISSSLGLTSHVLIYWWFYKPCKDFSMKGSNLRMTLTRLKNQSIEDISWYFGVLKFWEATQTKTKRSDDTPAQKEHVVIGNCPILKHQLVELWNPTFLQIFFPRGSYFEFFGPLICKKTPCRLISSFAKHASKSHLIC